MFVIGFTMSFFKHDRKQFVQELIETNGKKITLPIAGEILINPITPALILSQQLQPIHLQRIAVETLQSKFKLKIESKNQESDGHKQRLIELINKILVFWSYEAFTTEDQFILELLAQGKFEPLLEEDFEGYVREDLPLFVSAYPGVLPSVSLGLNSTITGLSLDLAGAIYSDYFSGQENLNLYKTIDNAVITLGRGLGMSFQKC